GPHVFEELEAVRRETVLTGRAVRLDEPRGDEPIEGGGALRVPNGVRGPPSPPLLDVQEHFQSVELLAKLPRATEKITHRCLPALSPVHSADRGRPYAAPRASLRHQPTQY